MSGLTDETAGKKNVPNKCRNEFSDIRAHGYFWICVVFVEAVIVVGFFVISEATVSFEILKYAYIQTDRQTGRQAEADTHSFETAFSAEWISLPLHFSSEHISLVNCLAHSIFPTPVDL